MFHVKQKRDYFDIDLVSMSKKRGFYIPRLSYKDKLNIYYEIKNGKTRKALSIKYKIGTDKIDYLVRLVDKHRFDIFRTTKNRKFNYYEKEQIINRVLINGESVWSVSID